MKTDWIDAAHHRLAPAIALAAAVLLAGCAGMAPKDDRPAEEIVMERAKARWDALLAGEIKKAAEYYAPAHRSSAEMDSLRAQAGSRRVKWRGVEFLEISCTETLCRPVFLIRYDYRSPLPRVGTVESSTRKEERWIRDDREWYFVPSDGASEGLR